MRALALLLLAGTFQPEPPAGEQELVAAARQGLPPAALLELARRVAARLPDRPYPWAVQGDALFRLRRLRSAAGAYREALSRTGEAARLAPFGRSLAANLAAAEEELARLERGIALAARARAAGWAVGLLLLLLLAWGAWAPGLRDCA